MRSPLTDHTSCPAAKKPIAGRILWTCAVVALAATVRVAPAQAQVDGAPPGMLTESEAVRRALARPALADAVEGAVGVARSEAVRESLWPDPELSYNREETFGGQGVAQDVLMVSQRFDVSGRRGLRTTAASHRAQAVSHAGDARRVAVEAEVRLRFHELLVAQHRVAAVEGWVRRIDSALEVVARREAAGDASAYDRRRLERERANARARLAAHRAEGDRAWARLAALMGETTAAGESPPPLAGALMPDVPLSVEQLVTRIESRPDILALDAEVAAAQADGDAAARWWVPKPGLGLGWTGIEQGPGRTDGYVAMVTMSVPLFDRKQDEELRAASEARLARGRRELAVTEASGEAQGRAVELSRLVEAARHFRRDAVGESAALMRTAEAGYAGDELGILDLLDAYRGGLDDEMTALDLEIAARRARVELDLLTGGHAP
jgi:cobalt-zinc-cadmium efflux system outer membrane protein